MDKKKTLGIVLGILLTAEVGFAQRPPAWVNDGLGADEDWTRSTTQLSANWAPVPNPYGYWYAIGTTRGGTDVSTWTFATGTSVTRSGLSLTQGKTYYFAVRDAYGQQWKSSDGIKVNIVATTLRVTPSPNALIFYKGEKRANLSYTLSLNGPVGARITREEVVYRFGNGTKTEVFIISENITPVSPKRLNRPIILDDMKRAQALSGKTNGRFTISRTFSGYDTLGNPIRGSSPIQIEVRTTLRDELFRVKGMKVILPKKDIQKKKEFKVGIKLRTSETRIGDVRGNIYLDGKGWRSFKVPATKNNDVIVSPFIPAGVRKLEVQIIYPNPGRIVIPIPFSPEEPSIEPEEEPEEELEEELEPEEEMEEGEDWDGGELDGEWEYGDVEGTSGQPTQIDWTEFEAEGAAGGITTGYQTVEDEQNQTQHALSTNVAVNQTRSLDNGVEIRSEIKANKQEFTTGGKQKANLDVGIKNPLWELALSGKTEDSLNTFDKTDYKSKDNSMKIGLGISVFNNFPIQFNYSNSANKNTRENVGSDKEVKTEDFNFSLGSKLGQASTDIILNLGKTQDFIEKNKTKVKSIGLTSNIPFKKIFELNLDIQSSDTDNIPDDESLKTSSESENYIAELISQINEKLKFITKFNLNNNLSKSQSTETDIKTFTQDYGVSWQALSSLIFRVGYNLSDTEESANSAKTHLTTAGMTYDIGEKKFLGQTGIEFQATKIKDEQGNPKSENSGYTLNLLFNLIKEMTLSCNFSNCVDESYSLDEKTRNLTHNLTLQLSQPIFENLKYQIGYVLDEQKTTERNITHNYRGDINYNLRIKNREFPLTFGQTYIYSPDDTDKIDTETKVSIRAPITEIVSTSYAYNINKGKTTTINQETTSRTVGMEITKAPFGLTTTFSSTKSNDSASENLNVTGNYSFLNNLSLNISFLQDRPSAERPTTSNFTTSLSYTF
ncbi:MAG: hypothetical protein AB1414_06265 [bacterium]